MCEDKKRSMGIRIIASVIQGVAAMGTLLLICYASNMTPPPFWAVLAVGLIVCNCGESR